MQATWSERYERFFELLEQSENLIPNAAVLPRWIGKSARFWYERSGESGRAYRVVDAQEGETVCDIPVATRLSRHSRTISQSLSTARKRY